MSIALRWREDPFDCEFIDAPGGAILIVYASGEIAWQEIVRTATAAYARAREIRDSLLEPRARRGAS